MKRLFISLLISVFTFAAFAQSARDLIRLGNAAYRAEQYEKAETYYLKSIAKDPSFEGYYNLGNAYIMQQKDSTAFENYKKADSIGTSDPMRKARNFHNMGNIWYAQGLAATQQQGGNAAGAFQNAVNFYKSSLRCNPADDETRYNLAMAQYQLKKNQDKNGGGGDDNKQEKDKDKQNQDKQKQDQQKQNEDQQKKDQDKQNQNQDQDKQDKQDQQQQQSNPNKDEMSDQAAEQLLNSAQQDEKGVQQKLNKNKNGKRRNLEKDW
ncbi:MAG: tetratricopeptide repeat protein [Prevotellaceae bacterium]|nr:tetratricopeptide repeat protein [Candidatus Minthosoma equi]